MSENQTPRARKPREETASVPVAFTSAVIALGTKRSEAALARGMSHLDVKVPVDFPRLPANVIAEAIKAGVTYWLRSEQNKVEKQVEKDRADAKEKGQPFSEPDLNSLVQSAVNARLEKLYAGDIGVTRVSMSPVERRAHDIIVAKVGATLRASGRPATQAQIEALAEQQWAKEEVRAAALRLAAEALERERQEASGLQLEF